MNDKPIQHIICAVRGKPESRDTVNFAIQMAVEKKGRLTFLHILDAEFLQHASGSRLNVVYQELVSMGEFAMLILVDRAQRKGVEQVDYVVLEGNIRRQLYQFLMDAQADILVLGKPRPGPGRNIFSQHEYDDYVAMLEYEAKIKVLQVSHKDMDASLAA